MNSEKSVAAVTKAIAPGPARSWTCRHRPVYVAASIGSDDLAMNPARHASECSASTSKLRNSTCPTSSIPAGALTPGSR